MLKTRVAKLYPEISGLPPYQKSKYQQQFRYKSAIAIALVVMVITIGQTIKIKSKQAAINQLAWQRQDLHLVNELEQEMLKSLAEQQQLQVAKSAPAFKQASSNLITSLARIKFLTNDVKALVSHAEAFSKPVTNQQRLVLAYETNVASYLQQLERVLEPVSAANLRSQDIVKLQQSLQRVANADATMKLNVWIHDLVIQAQLLRQAEQQTLIQLQAQTMVWDVGILAGCSLMSLAIAYLFTAQTHRQLSTQKRTEAISIAIPTITQFIQQVTATSNYSQRTPVITDTDDELSVLVTSLNQLLTKVVDRTADLEQSQQHIHNLSLQLQQAQTQLIQAEKMANLGQMVACIAHEINNPISFISGNIKHAESYFQHLLELVQLYQQIYPHPSTEIQDKIQAVELDFISNDFPQLIDSMQMGANVISQLSHSIRNFSRSDEAPVKNVDLHAGIDNILLILNHRLKKGISLTKQYGNISLVECYPSQLNQVFMNIISNSIDSLLANCHQQHKHIIIQTQMISEQELEIKISDNGQGIPPEIQPDIFQPFFTTKPIGKGTGLGLSICHQIIAKHQGEISVNSVVNQGTEFILTLPCYQK